MDDADMAAALCDAAEDHAGDEEQQGATAMNGSLSSAPQMKGGSAHQQSAATPQVGKIGQASLMQAHYANAS